MLGWGNFRGGGVQGENTEDEAEGIFIEGEDPTGEGDDDAPIAKQTRGLKAQAV